MGLREGDFFGGLGIDDGRWREGTGKAITEGDSLSASVSVIRDGV